LFSEQSHDYEAWIMLLLFFEMSLEMSLEKSKKSHFWIFKKHKNVFLNYVFITLSYHTLSKLHNTHTVENIHSDTTGTLPG